MLGIFNYSCSEAYANMSTKLQSVSLVAVILKRHPYPLPSVETLIKLVI